MSIHEKKQQNPTNQDGVFVEADDLETNATKLVEVEQDKKLKHKAEQMKHTQKKLQFSENEQSEEKSDETIPVDKLKTPGQQKDRKKTSIRYLNGDNKIISQRDVQEVYAETSPENTEGPFQSSGSEYVPDSSDDEYDQEPNQMSSKTILTYAKHHCDLFQSGSTVVASTSKKCNELMSEDNNLSRNNIDGKIVTFGNILQTTSKVEQFSNSRPWTKKNTCPYCFQDVTHFSRHLERNHKEESAVKEFLAMSKKNTKRKELLNAIRRQGNFSAVSHSKVTRPIRRPKGQKSLVGTEHNLDDLIEKYVVCPECLGYFKRNYLRRHRKCCAVRNESGSQKRESHLSAAQLFTVCSSSHNEFYSTLSLKNEVFPIMRNDEISKLAMKDALICCYAESLLKRHKRTQIKNVISNKMRELGRLLLTPLFKS